MSSKKAIIERTIDNVDLNYSNLAEGESVHDYVPIYLWYEKDPLYRGPGPRNSDLCIKLRCRNCGRIISMSQKDMISLFNRYEIESSINNRYMDFVKFRRDYDSYVLPDGVGPFSVRYIYDDGTMEVRELGHNKKSTRMKISRMDRLSESSDEKLLIDS